MAKIIADPGSTHCGQLNRAIDLINVAADCGVDAVKFQLFDNLPPNIPLNPEWLPELKVYADNRGIEFFCSVWSRDFATQCRRVGCTSVKYAFSQREKEMAIKFAIDNFQTVYISGDVFTDFPTSSKVVKLYCIPEYPVKYKIDFEGMFPRFDGFSSHTLGVEQDLDAIDAGATVIEKHLKLDDDLSMLVPDGRFALTPQMMYRLCRLGKGNA